MSKIKETFGEKVIELAQTTPNNMEFGEKVRRLYLGSSSTIPQKELNLKKLEAKLDIELEHETRESLTNWLIEKRENNKKDLNRKAPEQEIVVTAYMEYCRSTNIEYTITDSYNFYLGVLWQYEQFNKK